MRAALGLGGIAAFSAIAAGIVSPPRPEAVVLPVPAAQAADLSTVAATDAPTDQPSAAPTQAIRYVQLLPGQTAPPGATVIPAAAATPVIKLPGPKAASGGGTSGGTSGGGGAVATPKPTAKPVPKPTPIIIKTTQSGKPVP